MIGKTKPPASLTVALWAFLALGGAGAMTPAAASPHAITVDSVSLQVVDGDTVRFQGERLRLLDIDAPETSKPRCRAEARAGGRATEALRHLLAGQQVTIHYSGENDRYGRPLVRLSTNAGDLGAALVANGLALPYVGGSAAYELRKAHWCG